MSEQAGQSNGGVQRAVLIVSTLAVFLTPFMSSSANIALPAIGYEFKLDAATLGWVQASFLLSSAIFLIPFGRIGDIRGRSRVLALGLLVYALSTLAVPFSYSASILIAIRFLQGLGSAMIFGTSAAILASVFPPSQRGKVLGINTASVYVGLSMGPFLGGFLTQNLGWRSVFLFTVPIAALALLASRKIKRDWADARGERFDYFGSLLYGVALALIMLGASYISNGSGGANPEPFAGAVTLAMILAGGFMMAGFVAWESRNSSPVLDLRLFKNNRIFAFANLAALINYSATYALTFLLSLYLQLVRGFPPQVAGIILISQPLVQAVLSPATGHLSDRVLPQAVASLGMALNAIGLLLFAFIDAETSVLLIAANLVLMGMGFALFSSPNANALMGCVDRQCLGVASASLATMRSIGMIVSTILAISALTTFLGGSEISEAVPALLVAGIRASFLAFSVMCMIGVVASLIGVGSKRLIA